MLQRQRGSVRRRIEIPTSVPGLTTERLLVMSFLEGTQITRLEAQMKKLSARQRKAGIKRILTRVSEAYGRMMLYTGLFQADNHPGNILVQKGERHAL